MTALGSPGLGLRTLAPPRHSDPADSRKTRKVILVVEDDQIVREALGLMLEDDYDVLYAADGPPALELASARRPDVVLLDLWLPRMHGLEVLARLNAAARGIRVIVVTIADDTDIVVEAMRLGAVDFVAKPYEHSLSKRRSVSRKRRIRRPRLPEWVIPPRSVIELIRTDRSTPTWRGREGTRFRVGYYSRKDGLDTIWMVNEKGEYREAMDHEALRKYFRIIRMSRETDLYGISKRPLHALPSRKRKR